MEVSPQLSAVQQEVAAPIRAQLKPELPCILHRLEGLKVWKESGTLVSWLLGISNTFKLSWANSAGSVVIELRSKYKYSKFTKFLMLAGMYKIWRLRFLLASVLQAATS